MLQSYTPDTHSYKPLTEISDDNRDREKESMPQTVVAATQAPVRAKYIFMIAHGSFLSMRMHGNRDSA